LKLPIFNTDFETFTIYPNPASDKIQINFENDLKNASFRIYDFTGGLMKNGIIDSSNSIDISNLPIGMFNIMIQHEESILTQKLNVIR